MEARKNFPTRSFQATDHWGKEAWWGDSLHFWGSLGKAEPLASRLSPAPTPTPLCQPRSLSLSAGPWSRQLGLPTTFQNMFCLFAFILWLGSTGPENSPHLKWAKMGRSIASITVSSLKALLSSEPLSGLGQQAWGPQINEGQLPGPRGEWGGVSGGHDLEPRGSCCTVPGPTPRVRVPPKIGHPGCCLRPGWGGDRISSLQGDGMEGAVSVPSKLLPCSQPSGWSSLG